MRAVGCLICLGALVWGVEPAPYGEIFAMRADGTDVRQLIDDKWEDATTAWAPEP